VTGMSVIGRRYVEIGHDRRITPLAPATQWPGVIKCYPKAERIELSDSTLGEILSRANGNNRVRWYTSIGDRRVPLTGLGRSVAASGARYPVELYPLTPQALHHYDPGHHQLEVLRTGDRRAEALAHLARPPARRPDLVLVLSTVPWRNSVKYGRFGYRLQAMDVGVMVAQVLVAAGQVGWDGEVHLCFDEDRLDELLGLDHEVEGVCAVVTLHSTGGPPAPELPDLADGPAAPPTSVPASSKIADHPEVADLAAIRDAARHVPPRPPHLPFATGWVDRLAPLAEEAVDLPMRSVDLAAGMPKRRSAVRGYRMAPLALDTLGALLGAATEPYRIDTVEGPATGSGCALYCYANRIADLSPGVFRYRANRLHRIEGAGAVANLGVGGSLGLLRECCEASAVFVLVGHYDRGFDAFGDRWYRMVNAEAGVAAQRLCLAAAALGLDSHIHCGFDVSTVDKALGLTGLHGLAVITVGWPSSRGGWPERPV
jgi:SagB-type dehydrogenase family enzyme